MYRTAFAPSPHLYVVRKLLGVNLFPSFAPPAGARSFASEEAPPGDHSTNLERQIHDLGRRKLPSLSDILHRATSHRLESALSGFLPPKARPDKEVFGDFKYLWPGHHLVHLNYAAPNSELLPDGTDTIHAPGAPWTQRVWAGGKMKFPVRGLTGMNNVKYTLVEEIHNVKFFGRPGSEKIYVSIYRGLTPSHGTRSKPIVQEWRDLCFLPEEPGGALKSLTKPRAPISPPSDPDFTHSLVPTRALLFRFSALTFNAHAIHIDPEYTRNVYGLPNLVVHGPLTVILMLECLQRALCQYYPDTDQSSWSISAIDYKNLMPLFVDEEMTVCCKKDLQPSEDDASSPESENWAVWIQKAQGDKPTVAVRATARAFKYKMKIVQNHETASDS